MSTFDEHTIVVRLPYQKVFLVDITTGKARPTLLEEILRIIFSSDVLSPRDKVNIACASKEFKALVFEALLSEVIWIDVLSVQRTLKAWTTVYSRHTSLIEKLTINIPKVDKIMRDRRLVASYGMGPGPAAIAQFMTRLSGLRHIEVLSDVRFCWWSWLSAFSNVSSLRSFSMVITETGEEHHEQHISHKYLTRLHNAQFNSWNQLDNLHISIRDTGRTSTRVPVGFSRTLQPVFWVQRFLNIPTIRCLSLDFSPESLKRIIRPNLQSFLNLNTLRISTTLGEKDVKKDNLLKALSVFHKDVQVCLRLIPAKTTYIPLNPDSGPHETSHSEICILEIDGPVGLSVHMLSRSIPFEEYFPCGLKIYQPGAGEKIDTSFTYTASCDEMRVMEDIDILGETRSLHITSCSLHLDLIFGISQVLPNLELLEIDRVLNESKLDDHFFAIFGTDCLPKLRSLKTVRIPLLSFLGRELYMKDYLSGWSRYCSSTLRSVVLVPGTKWIRRSVSEHWETAGETVFPELLTTGFEQLRL